MKATQVDSFEEVSRRYIVTVDQQTGDALTVNVFSRARDVWSCSDARRILPAVT